MGILEVGAQSTILPVVNLHFSIMNQRRPARTRRNPSVEFPRHAPVNATQPTLQHLQQGNPVSDYDSDNQGYVSDYPSNQPPKEQTTEELNLSVLRRYNPEITTILSKPRSAFATIYDFAPPPGPGWAKSNIDGPLFICQLSPGIYGEDRYTAFVLNKRSMENFDMELREGEDASVEISGTLFIITNKQGHSEKIRGIYIYNGDPGTSTEKSMENHFGVMKTLATLAGTSRQAAEARTRHTNGYDGSADHRNQPTDVLGDLFRRAGIVK